MPDSKEISSAEWLGLFLCPRGALSPGPSPGGCIHRTWLGFQLRAALWDRSRAPPVAEAARRSVGNRKERLRDYASSPGEAARRSVGNRKEHLRDYASSPDDTAQLETTGRVGRCRIPPTRLCEFPGRYSAAGNGRGGQRAGFQKEGDVRISPKRNSSTLDSR